MVVNAETGQVVSMSPEEQRIFTNWLMDKMEENEDFLEEL